MNTANYPESGQNARDFERDPDLAAQRGVPSLVWRAGQDRRLKMILQWAQLQLAEDRGRVLVAGCGLGMYVSALLPHANRICGFDIETAHLEVAARNIPEAHLHLAACEHIPYTSDSFDLVLSHEVLEHVQCDKRSVSEIVRVLRPGGRAVIFAPNRMGPFETHGHYWRGRYYFGNTPLINYLPNRLRNRLAPHVRAYTPRGLRKLFIGEPVRIIHHGQIFPGWDNVVQHNPRLGRILRTVTYAVERSPLAILGLSHLLVVEKERFENQRN